MLSRPQGHSAAGRNTSMKNSNDTIGNRTPDLPACSAVPQPSATPRRFITAFTSARHLSLSWASSIQSIPPHPTFWRSILILSSHLRLSLLSLSTRFPHQNPVYAYALTHTRYLPRPSILLNLITQTIFGEQYGSLSSSLCSFLHSPVTSSLLGPNILLQYPILKHHQPTFLLQCQRPSFTPK